MAVQVLIHYLFSLFDPFLDSLRLILLRFGFRSDDPTTFNVRYGDEVFYIGP